MQHPDMSKVDTATLTVVQEVLRGFMNALMSSQAADPVKLASALEEFTGPPGLEPISKVMLLDLAKGASILAEMRNSKG